MNNGERFVAANRGTLTLWGNQREGDVWFSLRNSKRVKDSEPAVYEERKTLSLEDLKALQEVLRKAIAWGESRQPAQAIVDGAAHAAAQQAVSNDQLPFDENF